MGGRGSPSDIELGAIQLNIRQSQHSKKRWSRWATFRFYSPCLNRKCRPSVLLSLDKVKVADVHALSPPTAARPRNFYFPHSLTAHYFTFAFLLLLSSPTFSLFPSLLSFINSPLLSHLPQDSSIWPLKFSSLARSSGPNLSSRHSLQSLRSSLVVPSSAFCPGSPLMVS